MNPKSFILYLDLLGSLDELNDEQAGRLFKAIRAYHMSKAEGAERNWGAEFDSYMDNFITKLAFHPFRAAFERDADKYQSLVDRNRRNGKKGGRKKAEESKTQTNPENPVGFLGSHKNPKEPKQTHNDNDNVNDNDIIIGNPKGLPCQASQPDAAVPYQKIIDFWNRAMEHKGIAGVSTITAASKRGINVKARFKEHGLEKIYQMIINASESRFLNGYNSRGFKATFDWAFLPSNFLKILDGNYKNPEPYETRQNDKFSERRGTEPSNEDRKNFIGTF